MKLNRVIDEYERLEQVRRKNFKKSIRNVKVYFRFIGINAGDYIFNMNIEGSYHQLDIRRNRNRPYSELIDIKRMMEKAGCKNDYCHPSFYDERVCVAFFFRNLKKLCALAQLLGCKLDREGNFFYSIDSDVIFLFTIQSKTSH